MKKVGTKKKTAKKKTTTKKKTTRTSTKKSGSDYQRGIWTGTISFGLINIGVRVVSAKEEKDLHFTMLDPSNLSPIGYKYYNKSSGEDVKRNETVKAFEYKPDKYVVLSDADFKKANPKATQTIDIENFVMLNEIDPVFFDKSYYLVPSKGSDKAYGLLAEALESSGKVAIAKMVMHTKQHLVALMPRGGHILLEMLHFANQVKELRELEKNPISAKISDKEVKMASTLIEDMTEKWKPESYKDTYRSDIMKMVTAKVKAGKATEITEDYDEPETEDTSKVLDLMPLLRKSLEKKSKKKSRSRAAQ